MNQETAGAPGAMYIQSIIRVSRNKREVGSEKL